ncbi:VanZ family protein [Arthrobacter sp. 754]|uniref:VanZ family protein n=1 Tax=Arthrobacter sp. 754 TaxID=3156315 RepID=UPI0033926F56
MELLHWPCCERPERPLNYLKNPKLWRTVLIAMLIPLAFVAYWPSPVDQPVQGQLSALLRFLHARGIPGWFNYQFVEASANVVLFIPLGAVASLAFAEKRWWQIGALGLIVSGIMELGQLLFLHNRFASPLDVVTNTGGAVIGALLAAAALKQLRARHLAVAGP